MPGPRPVDLIPGRSVRATAPVRVCDVGGWTDTWFGSPGQVCSLAVGPGVTVDAALAARRPGEPWLHLAAPDLGIDRWLAPGELGTGDDLDLLGHAIEDVLERRGAPVGPGLDLGVRSAVPPGASLGTSAAVLVATLAALEALLLAPDHQADAAGLAVGAHRVEVERAGRSAGVQDGWAAAQGGGLLLDVGPYPDARPRRLALDPATRAALDARLVTVVLGRHDSSAVHGQVIAAVTSGGGPGHDRARTALRTLARLASQAAARLEGGDLDGWAEVLVAATEAQSDLHPALVGPAHQRAIDLARRSGAVGWKVNGAGGDGGSLTVVAGDPADVADLRHALDAEAGWQVLDLALAGSVAVT